MASGPSLNAQLSTWVTKTWNAHGADIRLFRVSHVYNGRANPVEDVKNLDQFKEAAGISSHKISRAIQDVVEEHALRWPGTLTYEVTAWGEAMAYIKTLERLKWQGKGEPDADEDVGGSAGATPAAFVGMLASHERTMFKETIAALQGVATTLQRELERKDMLIERLMKEYPHLLDIMAGLSDRSFEHQIKLKTWERTERYKDKGMQMLETFGAPLIGKLLGGEAQATGASVSMRKFFESIKADPERMGKLLSSIGEVLTEDEKVNLALTLEAFDAETRTKENAESPIKVEITNGAGS